MNCQKWQTDQGVVLIDCGLMFPDDALLGVDVVIPRLESVFAEGEKVLGIVLTHGHEDHIGALPLAAASIQEPARHTHLRLALHHRPCGT